VNSYSSKEIDRQTGRVIAAGHLKNGDISLKGREISEERTGRVVRRGTQFPEERSIIPIYLTLTTS